ncbi:MAG TPA: hypothetical protein VJZ00_09280 [Thermoanaerobaculia bacterium]|nr:hypothetical protein [Thermoanaerobaculia bacterium]
MADQEPDKEVTITLDGSGMPVPSIDPIPVKKNKQKIRWCATFPFTIDITGYTGSIHYGTGSGSCANSAKTDNFTVEQQYKYSITANNKTNDPDIDVKP